MTPAQEIRARALTASVERFKTLPAGNVSPEMIVDSARIYAIFISGDDEGNSTKPAETPEVESSDKPGGGQRQKAAKS